ncbi:hypothetical protein PSN45_003902 [Yamadazyma tenuis]|uniref:C2H2-type domain-containing protein n=1 Tax=Candida tenuis (strain ATCC 10573 / BCRC 21748 / CBS 615 / JCM 9827 / NBRC 10315 / NRRL Y-1498 / VKM Y-70) TaxID=590646 RepID=G3B4Y4_CANTC|nr:uncharacterized protein CANTEDRAFT_114052 [Yamadazyma tenuis ATCC 10573]EGV64019.1 hypothetical protein CANTEDRAFT_114052 [Yamadazyma tenuis ATCC 10573]WEJ96363.1 hypothetical protein PSN45_003902 [Yamadazyma tenuis]
MTSAHTQFNYNRRSSASSPYTIPAKHHHQYGTGVPHYSQHHRSFSQGHQTRPVFRPDNGEAIEDTTDEAAMSSSVPTLSREFVARRISEGESGRLKEELKCEACGKGYKHISSLAKHLWEHTPEWNVTKKLLISKHQQVQLLEAASILVGMTDKDVAESPGVFDSSSRRNSLFQDDDTPVHGRKNSVSQYPPSSSSATSSTSPPTVPVDSYLVKDEASVSFVAGGYLDSKAGFSDVHSESNTHSRLDSVSYKHSSTPNMPMISPRSHNWVDDEDIVGKME